MHLSFRARLVAAFMILLVPTLAIILVAVNHTTTLQIEAFTGQSVARSRSAFKDAEDLNRSTLTALGQRFGSGSRVPALILDNLRYGVDSTYFAEDLRYELAVTHANALVAFTDIDGRPMAGIDANRAVLAEPSDAIPAALIDSIIAGPDSTKFGYKLIRGRIFSVYASLVRDVEKPVGFIVMGQPIDTAMAENLGRAVDGQVCFLAAQRCVAATAGMALHGLTDADMVTATKQRSSIIARNGERWLLIADPMTNDVGWRVIARPLDALLQPFDDIKRVLMRIGILALLLAPLFAIVLARGLARPIRALVKATSRVARGDYTARVDVASDDEIGKLGHAFNEMSAGLLLKEKYRGLLDKVVSPEIADEMLRADVTLGGENREVTILFADVRGFTPMTEGMEPQDVIRILNETMQHASAVVDDEGGVVDKYIGDEIMALFGAPLSQPDDALRAVRAAVRMREAISSLGAQRAARGEPRLDIGIGINTGVVVAGNMGSERRLNYTVLGQAVNVAARLCSEAKPGQILIGERTRELIGDAVEIQPAGARELKGLSAPMMTYIVESMRTVAAVLVLVALALPFPRAVHAQPAPFATWSNNNGSFQATLATRLELTGYLPQDAAPWLIRETSPFIAPRASVYGEAFAGENLYGMIELRADRGEVPRSGEMQARIEQLFARYTFGTALEVQAGKFVSPFGTYAMRHGTTGDAFIRAPLAYEWPTLVSPGVPPRSTSELIARRDSSAIARPRGVPPVWSVPYQVGAMLFGTSHRAVYRVAVLNSAISSVPREWDRIEGLWKWPSLVAAAGMQVTPSLRTGASVAFGPYDGDAKQTLLGVDASYARDLLEVRGELLWDRWEVPNVDDTPADISWYVESRLRVAPGAFVGARVARMTFNKLNTGSSSEVWDYPVSRLQLAGGYQFTRAVSVRGEYQMTSKAKPRELADNLASVQIRVEL